MKFTLKICIVSAILLSATSTSIAQNTSQSLQPQCTNKSADFPAVRGLKLGLSSSDVLKIYPSATIKPKDENDVQNIVVITRAVKDEELKRNLRGIVAELLDNQVVRFTFMYDDSIKWESLTSFVEPLAESFNIPIKLWDIDSVFATATCSDFTLRAAVLGKEPSLTIEIKDYRQIITQRRKEIEEKKKKSFKP